MKNECGSSLVSRHPEQTPSEVTILNLNESLFATEEVDIDELIRNKYNE